MESSNKISTYDQYCQNSCRRAPLGTSSTISFLPSKTTRKDHLGTYSLRIAFTTARVYGAAIVGDAILPKLLRAVTENMQSAKRMRRVEKSKQRVELSRDRLSEPSHEPGLRVGIGVHVLCGSKSDVSGSICICAYQIEFCDLGEVLLSR